MTKAEKIRQLCKNKGISVPKLEKDLGYSNGSLLKRNGSGIKYQRIAEIAKYFDVPVDYLLNDELTDEKLLIETHNQGNNEAETSRRILAYTKELSEIYDLLSDASPDVQAMVLAMLKASKKNFDEN